MGRGAVGSDSNGADDTYDHAHGLCLRQQLIPQGGEQLLLPVSSRPPHPSPLYAVACYGDRRSYALNGSNKGLHQGMILSPWTRLHAASYINGKGTDLKNRSSYVAGR